MQSELDKIDLAKDTSLDQMKTQSISDGSAFIVNGTMCIVGNIGSGKTSLIAKLMVLYRKKIEPDIFYFFTEGRMDSTMSENINKHQIEITPIDSKYMEEFVAKYRTLKMAIIELHKYLTRDDYWSEALTELKSQFKVKSLLPKAKEIISKYSKPETIEVKDKKFPIKPIIGEKNTYTKSLMIFDDIAQFPEFTKKNSANTFFKELAANTRHFVNTSIFAMQRFTFIQKDVRVLTNTWCLGYGIATEDIKTLFKQSVTVEGWSSEEMIREYEKIKKYNFLVINSGLAIVDDIKINL